MEYSPRVVDAFKMMYELHRTQLRKGSHTPYIAHLMGVAALVGAFGGDEDQFIAALLHDAAEDQGGRETLARIEEAFGDTVAEYVAGCSDTYESPKPPWDERKEQYLETLARADAKVRLIVAADKLHNAREVVTNLHERGNDVWRIFKAGREKTLWFYAESVRALSRGWSHSILRELADAVDVLHREADRMEE